MHIELTWVYSVPILMWKITAGWTKTLETGCISAEGGEGSHLLCALWGVPVVPRASQKQSFRRPWPQAWGHSFYRVIGTAMQTQQVRGLSRTGSSSWNTQNQTRQSLHHHTHTLGLGMVALPEQLGRHTCARRVAGNKAPTRAHPA